MLYWGGLRLRGEQGILTIDWARLILIVEFASGSTTAFGVPAVGIPWFLAALFASRVLFNSLMALSDRLAKQHRAILLGSASLACCITGIIIGGQKLFLPLSFDVALIAVLFMWFGYSLRREPLAEKYLCINMPTLFDFAALVLWVLSIRFAFLEMAMRIYSPALLSISGALAGTFCVFRGAMLIERGCILAGLLAWCGRNSPLLLSTHTLESLINWRTLPLFEGIPRKGLVASVVRIAYDVCAVWLVGLIGYSRIENSESREKKVT